jgi:hypothetical protein
MDELCSSLCRETEGKRGKALPEEREHLAIMRRKKNLFPLPLYALMYM